MQHELSAPERVRRALVAAGVRANVVHFDVTTRTAADAAQAIGTTVGQIVKSLVFLADGQPLLALVSGGNQLDPSKLARLTGSVIAKADADMVRGATGFAIGGVPPIGFSTSLRTYVDRDLLQFDVVWAAAGTPHDVFSITPGELVRITSGMVGDLRRD